MLERDDKRNEEEGTAPEEQEGRERDQPFRR
jgi:hypothetical protein